MWWLSLFVPFALIAFVVWTYRKKRREQEAEQEARFKAMFDATLPYSSTMKTPAFSSNAAAVITPAMAAALTASPELKTPATVAVTYARKPRLFQQRHALLYYVLRAGLPDHEIFADHALADFIEAAGSGREPALRQLAEQRVDFIVCNKQMEVVAAVILGSGSTFARNALQAASVRIVLVNPDDLPKHSQVRDLIYN